MRPPVAARGPRSEKSLDSKSERITPAPEMQRTRRRFALWRAINRDPACRGLPAAVAWEILDRMGANDRSWPSAARLAADLSASQRAVQRAIALLVSKNYFLVSPGGRPGNPNSYALKSLTTSSTS